MEASVEPHMFVHSTSDREVAPVQVVEMKAGKQELL